MYASLGYGAIQVLFTIPTLFLIDTKGRRTLTMIVSRSLRDLYLQKTDHVLSTDLPSDVYLSVGRRSISAGNHGQQGRSHWTSCLVGSPRKICSAELGLTASLLDSSISSRSAILWAKDQSPSNTLPRCFLPSSESREWLGLFASTTLSVSGLETSIHGILNSQCLL